MNIIRWSPISPTRHTTPVALAPWAISAFVKGVGTPYICTLWLLAGGIQTEWRGIREKIPNTDSDQWERWFQNFPLSNIRLWRSRVVQKSKLTRSLIFTNNAFISHIIVFSIFASLYEANWLYIAVHNSIRLILKWPFFCTRGIWMKYEIWFLNQKENQHLM